MLLIDLHLPRFGLILLVSLLRCSMQGIKWQISNKIKFDIRVWKKSVLFVSSPKLWWVQELQSGVVAWRLQKNLQGAHKKPSRRPQKTCKALRHKKPAVQGKRGNYSLYSLPCLAAISVCKIYQQLHHRLPTSGLPTRWAILRWAILRVFCCILIRTGSRLSLQLFFHKLPHHLTLPKHYFLWSLLI